MVDLFLESTPKVGFACASKDDSTLYYTLSYVANGNGTVTGVRTVTLGQNVESDSYISENALCLKDSQGIFWPLNLSGVSFVTVGEAAENMYSINSVNDLIDALNTCDVTISLVEVIYGSSHSVGGATIYVTKIKCNVPRLR